MKALLLWCALILCPCLAQAQADTLQQAIRLTYGQAKAQMLKENLSLLASHYNVSIAEAEAMQAKFWNNPYLIWNQDLYSVERNEYFNFKNQRLIQIEQVFSIAGKHTNTVKLAKISVELSKLQMEDVLRSLLLELGDQYAALHAAQQKRKLYEDVLNKYGQLVRASEQQLQTGSLAGNEVIRLKSELITVQADFIQNANEIESLLSTMRTLLNLPSTLDIETVETVALSDTNSFQLPQLIATSIESRPDYRLSNMQIVYEKRNLRLQKSMSVPDIKLAYQPHDKGSNYVRPYTGFNIEMPLPVFDRNQGRIQAAKASIEQAQLNEQLKSNTLQNEVTAAYYQLLNARRGLENYSAEFIQKVEELNTNTNINYNKKNISFLEYIDQQRIYIQTKIQHINLKNEYTKSVNQLNFSVGKEII